MRLRVEIDDLVEEFNFDKQVVFVGSHPKCHISLDYEGVGEKHLRIIEHQGMYIAQDLNSGFKTRMNGRTLKAGGKVKFQTFFPLEIAGIFIHLLNEADEELGELTGNAYKINFDDVKQELTESNQPLQTKPAEVSEQDPQEKDEMEGAKEDPKKYRPQLYRGGAPKETEEFKIKNRQVNVQEQKQKLKKKSRSRKPQPTSKRPKQIRQAKYVGHRYNLNTMIIIFCTLIVIAGVYYKKNYGKTFGSMKGLVASKADIKDVKLVEITNTLMQKYSESYKEFSVTPKCISADVISLCESFPDLFQKVKGEGVVLIKDTAFIGINFDKIEKEMDKLFEITPEDEAFFDSIYKRDYAKYAPFEQFVKNGRKATFADLETKAQKCRDIIYIFKKLLDADIKLNPKIKYLHFFTFDKFQGELTVNEFYQINTELLEVIAENKPFKYKLLKSFWSAKLADNAFNFLSSFGDSRHFLATETLLKMVRNKKLIKSYEKYLTEGKCLQPETESLCKTLEGANQVFEGFIQEGDQLYLVVDLDRLINKALEKYKNISSYSFKEKNAINVALSKKKVNPGKKEAILSGQSRFYSSNEANRGFAIAELLYHTDLKNQLKGKGDINKLTILGAKVSGSNSLPQIIIEIDKARFGKFSEAKTFTQAEIALKLFWKSGLVIDNTPVANYSQVTNF